MPNWCSCSMCVHSKNKNQVQEFYEALKRAKKAAETTKNWELYQIYEELGFDRDFILNDAKSGYNRGSIIDILNIKRNELGEYYFYLEYESAWSPMIDGFDFLIKSKFPELKEDTLAEECGCEVFINTDATGKYFSEKYYLYVEDLDTYYLSSDEELIKTFNSLLQNQKVHSVKECYDLLEKQRNDINGMYVCLQEFGSY